MFLPSIMKYFEQLGPGDALTYAPALGRPDLRQAWKKHLIEKNPSLKAGSFSTPIVTGGVTHALSLIGDLFVDRGDMVLLPDMFWENYELQFGVRYGGQLAVFPSFNASGGFNVEAFRQAMATRAGSWKTIVILNFPNNPTGYSIKKAEADEVVNVLRESAEDGRDLVVVTDDAYFGLFYDDDVLPESLFAKLAGLHERILAVKVDGPTKEQFVWGFRTGNVDVRNQGVPERRRVASGLERKVAGAIRSAISNCSHPAQSILVRAMADPALAEEKEQKKAILQARAAGPQVLAAGDYSDVWEAYPFNAGLLHVPEAERRGRRRVPQTSVGQIRRRRHLRRHPRHPRRVFVGRRIRVGIAVHHDGQKAARELAAALLVGCHRDGYDPIPPRAGNVAMDSSRLAVALNDDPFAPWPTGVLC
jgi:aspartate/methionine/tyrosine aminotransferase